MTLFTWWLGALIVSSAILIYSFYLFSKGLVKIVQTYGDGWKTKEERQEVSRETALIAIAVAISGGCVVALWLVR